jgi:hypothetical protein
MGYTHYWEHPRIDDETWNAIRSDAEKLIAAAIEKGIKICGPMAHGEPEIDESRIALNGTDDDDLGHESFVINRTGEWVFCKTVRKPYDLVAAAMLIVLKHHHPTASVRSDGNMDDEEWHGAVDFAESVLGYGFFPVKPEEG